MSKKKRRQRRRRETSNSPLLWHYGVCAIGKTLHCYLLPSWHSEIEWFVEHAARSSWSVVVRTDDYTDPDDPAAMYALAYRALCRRRSMDAWPKSAEGASQEWGEPPHPFYIDAPRSVH